MTAAARIRCTWPIAAIVIVSAAGASLWAVGGRGGAQTVARGSPRRQGGAIDLPAPPGQRFDYLTIDEDDHYLLVAHLGAGLLHVVDLRDDDVVGTVRDVPGVEGR